MLEKCICSRSLIWSSCLTLLCFTWVCPCWNVSSLPCFVKPATAVFSSVSSGGGYWQMGHVYSISATSMAMNFWQWSAWWINIFFFVGDKEAAKLLIILWKDVLFAVSCMSNSSYLGTGVTDLGTDSYALLYLPLGKQEVKMRNS